MMMRKRLLQLLAVLFAFTLVAAACGNDDDGDDGNAATDAGDTADGGGDTDGDDGGAAEIPTELAGLTIVDDRTFTVELTDADPEFNRKLSYAAYYPLPEVAFDDPVAFEERPIGNGPFQMDGDWQHDVAIEMTAYPDYAGPDAPNLSTLEYRIIPDDDTAYLELQAGNIDAVKLVPIDALATAPDEFGDRYKETPETTFYYYGFPSYLEDEYPLALRRALSMATDRELLIDTLLEGTRIPADSVIPPSLRGGDGIDCANWQFDADAAQAAFDEFGGLDALGDDPIVVWFNAGSNHDQIAENITNQWRNNLGIDNVEFESLEFSEYLPVLDEQAATGVFRLGWGMDYPSALNFLEPLYASYNAPLVGSNNTFYDNAEFDDLLAQGKAANAAGDLAGAQDAYLAAEQLLCDDVPVMPIYYNQNIFAHGEDVSNVTMDAFSNFNITQIEGDDFVSNIVEPEHLFPTTSNESEGIAVLRALFKGLIDYDPETLEPFNAVAESIESDDGGQTWTITLAEGWTFHDGSPVTAQSFVDAWNYGALGSNGQQNNSFYANIVGYDEMNPPSEEESE